MATNRDRVYAFLVAHMDQWVDGFVLASAAVGGSEGLRRVRELRADDYAIYKRRKPGSKAFQYRLASYEP